MIGYVTGTVLSINNPLLVNVSGIGYLVYVPPKLQTSIKLNQNISLFTHTHVREDILELYGFSSQSELSLFNMLLRVGGIGPKTALLVIDQGEQKVNNAIFNGDVDFFTTIPRLGKKNAQKIIIELKNKIGSLMDLDLTGETKSETRDLIDALTSMGFSKGEVFNAIKKLGPTNDSLESKIRQILKILNK